MTDLTASAIRAVRARFGDDADAVMVLRAAHKTVRPFCEGYAVDEQLVDSAELQRMADAVTARRDAGAKRTKQKTAGLGNPSAGKGAGTTDRSDGPGSALADHSNVVPGEDARAVYPPPQPDAECGVSRAGAVSVGEVADNAGGSHDAGLKTRRQEVVRVIPPAVLCPCGRPRGHGGRCWHKRGMPGPTLKRAQPRGRTCGCGGPLSYSAKGELCRKCVLAKVRKTSGQAAKIAAIEAEVATLEARQAAFEATVKAAAAELLERIDNLTGEGR